LQLSKGQEKGGGGQSGTVKYGNHLKQWGAGLRKKLPDEGDPRKKKRGGEEGKSANFASRAQSRGRTAPNDVPWGGEGSGQVRWGKDAILRRLVIGVFAPLFHHW